MSYDQTIEKDLFVKMIAKILQAFIFLVLYQIIFQISVYSLTEAGESNNKQMAATSIISIFTNSLPISFTFGLAATGSIQAEV